MQDILAHGGRHIVRYICAHLNFPPYFGGADRHFRCIQKVQAACFERIGRITLQYRGQLPQRLPRPRRHRYRHLPHQSLPVFPCVQRHKAVHAHQPPPLCIRINLLENLHSINGVGFPFAYQIHIARRKARVQFGDALHHLPAVLPAHIGMGFMVRIARWHKQHAVQRQFVGKGARHRNMAAVQRIEAAAEESDFLHSIHFIAKKEKISRTKFSLSGILLIFPQTGHTP